MGKETEGVQGGRVCSLTRRGRNGEWPVAVVVVAAVEGDGSTVARWPREGRPDPVGDRRRRVEGQIGGKGEVMSLLYAEEMEAER